MTGETPKKKGNGTARPVRTRRDLADAASAVKGMPAQPGESAAEKRLQSLLHEMDKFEESDEDEPGTTEGDDYSGPQRRWSDDSSDPQ